jgi:two-component system, OmpR family, response regulator RegX3
VPARRRRILVLDPEPFSARLLRLILADEGHDVVVAGSAAVALAEIQQREVSAVLLELDLPDGDGDELCREVRARGYRGPVLFVSSCHETSRKIAAFRSGADDFVEKPYDAAELLARIDSAARRSEYAGELSIGDLVRAGDAELSISDLRFVAEGRQPVRLTPTEMRLLECLMRNPSITITRDTLIDRTWPDDFVATPNRVDVYVGRLRRKIAPDPDRPPFIQTVRGVGYRFVPQARRVVDLPLPGHAFAGSADVRRTP